MARSKRQKVVALTKVKKKGKDWKAAIIEKARGMCQEYAFIHVFKYKNMRNDRLKELREDVKGTTTFLLASTKKLQCALGRRAEDEVRDNLHLLSRYLNGHAGLIFTRLPPEQVEAMLKDFEYEDFARAGARATRTVVLPEGPLLGPGGAPFPHTMEHTLRAHGLPTKLNKGVIELIAEHTVCTEGKQLTSHQAALLRHFDIRMASFIMRIRATWCADTGEVTLPEDDGDLSDDERADAEDDDVDGLVGALQDGLPASMMLPGELK